MIDVATIQTDFNSVEKRVINAPRQGDSVLLDLCPKGTLEVHSFNSVKEAAQFMNCSVSTVRRQAAKAEDAEREAHDLYE